MFQDSNIFDFTPEDESVYQEEVQEAKSNKITFDILAAANEISIKLHKENMIDRIIDKSEFLPDDEKLSLGDQIINLIDRVGVKYLSVLIPDDEEEDNKSLLLFPAQTYKSSIIALAEVLTHPCNCSDPKLSHKNCVVNTDYEYSTTDSWFLLNHSQSDHIMSYPKRIQEFAEELDCPYKLLTQYDNMIEIIDWVNTDERLGWSDPPTRRQNFIEDMSYDRTKDKFNENADVHSLFSQYIHWVESETNERTKAKLLNRGFSILQKFGTSDGYFTITLRDKSRTKYMIPYLPNRESIDMLWNAVKKEYSDHTPPAAPWKEYCRCGSSSEPFGKPLHNCIICNSLTSKREVLAMQGIDSQGNKFPYHVGKCYKIFETMVDPETLLSMLDSTCPYSLCDNAESLNKLFID